jgi:SAM-dependent methyltransferase
MIFANPVPKSFADGSFYDESGSSFYLSDEKLKGDYSPVRYAREISMLRQACPSGSVLDVGCSSGGFLYHLNQTFPGDYQIYGTDVAADALTYAEQNAIKVMRGNFLEFEGVEFDAITFWAVLEHVFEPAKFLATAERLLRPGGICIVLTPNVRSLATRLLGGKYRYILPQHINYFSSETLIKLAASCGFLPVRVSSSHFNPLVILQDFRSRSGFVSDTDRARLLGKTNALKASPIMAPAKKVYAALESVLGAFGLADNIVAVLQKKGSGLNNRSLRKD